MLVQWSYQWARKFSASRFEVLYHVVQSDFFQKEFSVQINHFLVVPKEGNQALYVPNDEYNTFAKKVFEKLVSNVETYEHYKALIKQNQHAFVQTTQHIASQQLQSLSLQELRTHYKKFFTVNNEFFNTAIWIPFSAEPFISAAALPVLESLVNEHGAGDHYQQYFDAVFLPETKNSITREREALLEMVEANEQRKWSNEQAQQQLQAHAQRYQWIPCYDINDTPWTLNDFQRLFAEAKESDWKQELMHLREWGTRAQQFQRTLKLLKPNKNQELLLRKAHEMVFIKDERDDYRRQGSYNIQPLFVEIGQRLGNWTLDEVTTLLSSELFQFFDTGRVPSRTLAQERLNGYVLLYEGGNSRPSISSGQNAEKIIQEQLQNTHASTGTEVHGICGSRGSATGKVVIVHTKNDLPLVKQGDIIVAVTTHPDFVPAMRRAAAIVTDEGGVTSHAAIVSRELHIPCVVGTTTATTTFSDGEMLIVDADNGTAKRMTQ